MILCLKKALRQRMRIAFFFFSWNFYFVLRCSLLTNNVIVSGEQLRVSAIHIHVSVLPQTPLPSRLPDNIEQSSLGYTVGPCWLRACMLSHFSHIWLCGPMDCSMSESSVCEFLQTRMLEWVAMPSSRGSSRPRDWTRVSCIGSWVLYH